MNQPITLPPHNTQAEEAVLGSLMVDPLSISSVSINLKPDDFYTIKNGWIYAALQKLGESADLLTVSAELAAQNLLDEVGGEAYLAQLSASVPTALNVNTYANIVAESATKRRLINAASEIAKLGYSDAVTADAAIQGANNALNKISLPRAKKSIKSLAGMFDEYAEFMDAGKSEFTTSGVAGLDALLDGGLIGGDFCAIGGAPGFGKTALAAQIAYENARRGRKVIYFSFEVQAAHIFSRIISRSLAQKNLLIPYSAAIRKTLSEEHMNVWMNEAARFTGECGENLIISDPASLTPAQIKNICISEGLKRPVDVVIIDQLHHVRDDEGAKEQRIRVGNVAASLRELPKQVGAITGKLPCIIAPAYISRDGYDEPDLGNFKESGDIEYAISVALFLYGDISDQNTLKLKLAKSRNGAVGKFSAAYRRAYGLMK